MHDDQVVDKLVTEERNLDQHKELINQYNSMVAKK